MPPEFGRSVSFCATDMLHVVSGNAFVVGHRFVVDQRARGEIGCRDDHSCRRVCHPACPPDSASELAAWKAGMASTVTGEPGMKPKSSGSFGCICAMYLRKSSTICSADVGMYLRIRLERRAEARQVREALPACDASISAWMRSISRRPIWWISAGVSLLNGGAARMSFI